MPTTAPYGSWESPITAAGIAAAGHPVEGGAYVGDQIWWSELRPAEHGRYAVRRHGPDGEPVDILGPPWNARTRVHEYGGGAWTASADGVLAFAEFSDQRLYRLDPGADQPRPLTPEPPEPASWRYGDLQLLRPGELWCVRERHQDGEVARDIAVVPLDGSAAEDENDIRSVVAGSHFLAAARVSPDGARLAWIAWEHPQMPWDGTELRVGELGPDGRCASWRTVLGSSTESVLQPEWASADQLWVSSERSGFWNLYRVEADGSGVDALCPMDAEFGGPMWSLGTRWHRPLADGRLLTVRSYGLDTLGILDPATGTLTDVPLDGCAAVRLGPVRGQRVLLVTSGGRVQTGLRELDLDTGELTLVRLSADTAPSVDYLPEARSMAFPTRGGDEVHAVVYPPHNVDYVAPDGELPPYVALVHGGPTAHTYPMLSELYAYFTSRGIGIIDVNYGGSTSYGRAYRERLRGQWGIVDVDDTVDAVRGLAAAGLADPARLAIEGGSAGGWTVLSALTQSDVFACGVSYFGVAELEMFARETHDFESRYLDGLIGPLPEATEVYRSRAPVNNVAGLSCPVLLLQGLDDPIVPPSQAERFRDALQEKGIPHAYRAYAGESHGFRRSETQIDAREAELSFYGQVLGFEPPGVARLELWQPDHT
jgi:dipeptidyl aminopeptidase/acylaminoacyl peptidase